MLFQQSKCGELEPGRLMGQDSELTTGDEVRDAATCLGWKTGTVGLLILSPSQSASMGEMGFPGSLGCCM